MNRYPAWKYILIGVALAFGLLYTLPNFFPEVPAVQVSSSKATVKIDNALLGTVEDALKAANIPFRGADMDAVGIKVRLSDTDTQLKAKVQKAVDGLYANGTMGKILARWKMSAFALKK